MKHCKTLVKDRPSGEDLESHATIKTALSDASACSNCKQHAWDDIHAFLSLVMIQIDKAIAKVGSSSLLSVVLLTLL